MTNVEKFNIRVLYDKNFAEKLKNAIDREQLLKIAKENGYNFTNKELKSQELTDALDDVSGGKDTAVYTQNVTVTGDNTTYFKGGDDETFWQFMKEAYGLEIKKD